MTDLEQQLTKERNEALEVIIRLVDDIERTGFPKAYTVKGIISALLKHWSDLKRLGVHDG